MFRLKIRRDKINEKFNQFRFKLMKKQEEEIPENDCADGANILEKGNLEIYL